MYRILDIIYLDTGGISQPIGSLVYVLDEWVPYCFKVVKCI